MTKNEYRFLKYLKDHPDITHVQLSVFDGAEKARDYRRMFDFLVTRGMISFKGIDDCFRNCYITPLGEEAVEEYEQKTEKRNLNKKSYRISVIALIVSILALTFSILSKWLF